MRTKGDVFDAIFSRDEAPAMKFKADLYEAIMKAAEEYSQQELQIIFHEPQPRISELLNGKLGHKSLEKLFFYASKLGIEVRSSFPRVHKEVPHREVEIANV